MNRYELIKKMTLDEMARELTEQQCKECGYRNVHWSECEETDCWCHKSNNYEHYKEVLNTEVKPEYVATFEFYKLYKKYHFKEFLNSVKKCK